MLFGCDMAGYDGFFPGDRYAQVGVALLAGAGLGLRVAGVGSLVAVAVLIVTAIGVILWRRVGVAGAVGSQSGFTAVWERKQVSYRDELHTGRVGTTAEAGGPTATR